ncbi:MAG: anaerobic ribonucleoside-triphosphate reductase activating protein [Thermoguttaceae bacterium]|nr:anaerobic ribonucleoside-triphosphate reductase activating protein [Thermoguttaceae bacterium]
MTISIGGLQKFSLLDFPDRICAIVFVNGCNFRCPCCHNPSLIQSQGSAASTSIKAETVLSFLSSRVGKLDGVCVTGGEPLAQSGLPDFLRRVRELGFQIKLDTNGSFPDRLEAILNEKLVDYVAMDIKNSPEKYSMTTGCDAISFDLIKSSAALLLAEYVPYEFRTTLVREFHTEADLHAMGQAFRGASRYYLQNFRDSGSILGPGPLHSFTAEELNRLALIARQYFKSVEVRI